MTRPLNEDPRRGAIHGAGSFSEAFTNIEPGTPSPTQRKSSVFVGPGQPRSPRADGDDKCCATSTT